jgi:hypothetical protein
MIDDPPATADCAMLSWNEEADASNSDGRGAPDGSLGGGRWRGQGGTTAHQERFWREVGLDVKRHPELTPILPHL